VQLKAALGLRENSEGNGAASAWNRSKRDGVWHGPALPKAAAVSVPQRGQSTRARNEHNVVIEWLVLATNLSVDAIDWLALVLIVVGAIEAFFLGLWTMFSSHEGHHEREVWLRLGRWLVAGLTFQLAADVLETAITTSWDEVARLAAIAAIRTFLNYFLERDLGEIRVRQTSAQSDMGQRGGG
jgi:uncharacterized membrane protein